MSRRRTSLILDSGLEYNGRLDEQTRGGEKRSNFEAYRKRERTNNLKLPGHVVDLYIMMDDNPRKHV